MSTMRRPVPAEAPLLTMHVPGFSEAMDVEFENQAKFRYLPSEATGIILAGAEVAGVPIPDSVEMIATAACLQVPHDAVVTASKQHAERSVVAAEKEIRRNGYSDEAWLSRWRYPTYKYAQMDELQKRTEEALLRTIAHMFTAADPLSEPTVGRSPLFTKINKRMIAVGALTSVLNMAGYAASPSARELFVSALAAGGALVNYKEGKRPGYRVALGARGERLFQELHKQAYVRRAANQTVRAIPVFGPSDPYYVSEETI